MPNWCLKVRAVRVGRYRIREKQLTPELQIVGYEYDGRPTYIDKSWPAGQGVVVHTLLVGEGLVIQKNKIVNYFYDEPVPDVDYVAADYYHEDVPGWEPRVDIGDLISYKPYDADYWKQVSTTTSERFFVIPIADEERVNLEALCEEHYDIVDGWPNYKDYTVGEEVKPAVKKKRRMKFEWSDIQLMGVNEVELLDYWTSYRVNLPMVDRTLVYDGVNSTKVKVGDGLNLFPPHIVTQKDIDDAIAVPIG